MRLSPTLQRVAYRAFRSGDGSVLFRDAAERAALEYMDHVETQGG